MFFRKKKSPASCFSEHYKRALSVTRSAKWIENADYELLPAMFVICDYAAASAGKDRRVVADSILAEIRSIYPRFITSTFDQRVELYGEVIRGVTSLRGEFALGNTEVWNGNPIMKVAAVWGDITVNPECASDYEGAPMMIRGIDVVMGFFSGIMKPVLDEMGDLFKDIYDM